MQHSAMKHHSPEVVAGCTWFQNLKDNTDQHRELCDPTICWCFTQEFVSAPIAKECFRFCVFSTLCVNLCAKNTCCLWGIKAV